MRSISESERKTKRKIEIHYFESLRTYLEIYINRVTDGFLKRSICVIQKFSFRIVNLDNSHVFSLIRQPTEKHQHSIHIFIYISIPKRVFYVSLILIIYTHVSEMRLYHACSEILQTFEGGLLYIYRYIEFFIGPEMHSFKFPLAHV